MTAWSWLKKIDTGFWGKSRGCAGSPGQSDSPWLGIDSQSLQENPAPMENARKVVNIQVGCHSDDEFGRRSVDVLPLQRQTSKSMVPEGRHHLIQEILESELDVTEKSRSFQRTYLNIRTLNSREEAEAIWTDPDAVFQMDKWYEITSHMTEDACSRKNSSA